MTQEAKIEPKTSAYFQQESIYSYIKYKHDQDENLLLSDLRLKAKATFNLYIMPHIENALIAQELLIYLGTFQFSDI